MNAEYLVKAALEFVRQGYYWHPILNQKNAGQFQLDISCFQASLLVPRAFGLQALRRLTRDARSPSWLVFARLDSGHYCVSSNKVRLECETQKVNPKGRE